MLCCVVANTEPTGATNANRLHPLPDITRSTDLETVYSLAGASGILFTSTPYDR